MTSVKLLSSRRMPAIRPIVRDALVVLGAILLTPLWLPARIERRCWRGEGWFVGSSELMSLIPGRFGVLLRRSFYWMTIDRCGVDVHIGFGTTLSHPQVEFGVGVYIGIRCTVGKAVIDDHATIGSNVDILSGRRQHNIGNLNQPIQAQGGEFSSIRIGRNAWIGNSSVVMADIGGDCVIGAGSVVVKPIADCTVAVGNPAIEKKRRVAA